MNIYDFDGTIYSGDSTFDFYFYALGKKPSLARFWPKQAAAFALYAAKKISKTQMKERFYAFLTGIDAEAMLADYWDTHEKNIFPYYREQQREDDIIISASPEFLLKPICARLGIQHLMASRVDPRTGKTEGLNCWGEEKVRRLKEQLGIDHCENFYSDSHSDTPLAKIADHAFLVDKDGKLRDWE